MAIATPRVAPGVTAEARIVGVVAALWLVPWAMLFAAAWMAGGRPSASPLEFIDPSHIAQRFAADGRSIVWWHLVDAYGPVRAWLFWLSLAGLFAGATALVSRLGSARWRVSALMPRSGLHRSVGWATRRDIAGLLVRKPRHGSFVIGARGGSVIVTQAETSVLVIGPTRSGKTSALVVPNLFDWAGPAIVTSTKSELVAITAAHRQSLGPVHVYDPTGEIGDQYRSVTWSPISGCEDLDRAWMVASWLCAGLQQGGNRGDNDWAHWAESGKLLIAPLLFVAATTDRSIVDVRTWIHSFDIATPLNLLEELLFDEATTGTDDPARAIAMLMAVDQRPEKERGTVFSTVMRIFNVFNERAVAESAMSCRLVAEEFLSRSGTLFLCTPRQSPERVSSLFVGLLMTVVTAAYRLSESTVSQDSSKHLGLFLDELANVVPIEDLPSLASQGAGRGVLLMSIVQDLSQLRTRYGPDRAHSILNNHACKIVLPGISDPETAETLSRLIGRGEFTDVQINQGSDGRNGRSYSVKHDPIATPDALRQLRDGSAIVVHRGSPPALVRLRPWYRSNRYRAMAQRRFFRNAEYARRPGET